MMIIHVTPAATWQSALERGFYETGSLQLEGFIHCCHEEQLTGVIRRYYRHTPNLVLLHIDETLLTAPLRYEVAPSVNEAFPHVYGPINLDAVVSVIIV